MLTGIGQSGFLERRPVVVDPVRLGVLGQREDLAVIRERVARRGQEFFPVQARIVGDQVVERQERTAGRELGREVVTRAQRVGRDPAGDLPERCLGRLVVRLADVLVALDRDVRIEGEEGVDPVVPGLRLGARARVADRVDLAGQVGFGVWSWARATPGRAPARKAVTTGVLIESAAARRRKVRRLSSPRK